MQSRCWCSSSWARPATIDATDKLDAIQSAFDVSLVLFLPLVVVVLAALSVPAVHAIITGALAGAALAVVVAPERVISFAAADLSASLALLKGVWLALASGYTSTTGFAPIDLLAIARRHGPHADTIWLIVMALAFGGVVEKAGVIERLITPITEKARRRASSPRSPSSIVATNVITADQYIAIVLPGGCPKSASRGAGSHRSVLSRRVGDSATATSALIPWNSCGAFMAATLGVTTWSYAPYAVFSLRQPAADDCPRVRGFPYAARASCLAALSSQTGKMRRDLAPGVVAL